MQREYPVDHPVSDEENSEAPIDAVGKIGPSWRPFPASDEDLARQRQEREILGALSEQR